MTTKLLYLFGMRREIPITHQFESQQTGHITKFRKVI